MKFKIDDRVKVTSITYKYDIEVLNKIGTIVKGEIQDETSKKGTYISAWKKGE